MKNIPQNFLKVIKHIPSLSIWVITGVIAFLLIHWFTDYGIIYWNMWETYKNAEFYSNIVMSALIWIFIASSFYKIYLFSDFSAKQNSTWIIWSFLWIITVGCPACALTVGSYIWLGGILTSMPFFGMEIKIIGILIMLVGIFFTLKDLETCKISIKNSNNSKN